MDNKPWVYMMVGVPCSGKSTFLQNIRIDVTSPYFHVASSDAYIEAAARALDTTYEAIFQDVIKHSTAALHRQIQQYLKEDISFTWDQTNLSVATRKKKLAQIPKRYHRAAIFMHCPRDVVLARNVVRAEKTGKNIPLTVFADMFKSLEEPTFDEGFDRIDVVDGSFGYVISTDERHR